MDYSHRYSRDCEYQNEDRPPEPYSDSVDGQMKNLLRSAVRKATLTKSQRDVTLYLLNLWFYHRGGAKGYIDPGKEVIAASAKVSTRTAARALAMLREGKAIKIVGNATGGKGNTRYTLNTTQLLKLFGYETPTLSGGKLRLVYSAGKPETARGTHDKMARGEAGAYIDIYNKPKEATAGQESQAEGEAKIPSEAPPATVAQFPYQEMKNNVQKLISWKGKKHAEPKEYQAEGEAKMPSEAPPATVAQFPYQAKQTKVQNPINWKGKKGNHPMLDLLEQNQMVQRKILRKHQTKAIEMVRQEMSAGIRRVVNGAGTGFGKTLTAAEIIRGALAKGKRVIFTVPAISLFDQTVKAFEAEGIRDIGVMQGNHPRTDASARLQVASVQTLSRRRIPEAALVLVDECHIRSEVIDRLMKERADVYFIGLSATPWAKGMGLHWQKLLMPITLEELIEQGYLSKFNVSAPDEPDLSKVRTKTGDYAEADLETIMSEGKLVSNVVTNWLAHGENRPTLGFAVNRAHAADMAQAFAAHGVATGYCDAFTDPIERKILERKFRSGEIKVVWSVRTLTTGVDWPVSCIIDAAPTKSEILHVQKIGRGLRINEGTEDLLVFDHASNSTRLGLVTNINRHALDCSM